MGTNFYWHAPVCPHCGETARNTATYVHPDIIAAMWAVRGGQGHPDPSDYSDLYSHIGKRSAARLYCWDCNKTLCKGGEEGVHYGKGFFDACPSCGAQPTDEKLTATGHPAGVELGFASPNSIRPTGVRGACSFSWAQPPNVVRTVLPAKADALCVADEYGRLYRGR